MVAPRMPSRPTRMRVTNCSAVSAAKAASNVSTSAPSRPVAASRRSFDGLVGETKHRIGRPQQLARVRLEGDGDGRSVEFGRARGCRIDHGAVAAVHAVEIADRRDRAAETARRAASHRGLPAWAWWVRKARSSGEGYCDVPTLRCSAPRSQPFGAGRAGTDTTASPSSTSLPSTLASQCSRTMRPLGVSSTTSTMTWTTSPIFTGPWKLSVCER